VRGEPVALSPGGFFVLLAERVIEHLDFDAVFRKCSGLQLRQRMIRNPGEHTGVPRRLEVSPFDHELEVCEGLPRAQNANRLSRAGEHLASPRPRILIAVHPGEISLAERLPYRHSTIHARPSHST